jgi:hypothetical protein
VRTKRQCLYKSQSDLVFRNVYSESHEMGRTQAQQPLSIEYPTPPLSPEKNTSSQDLDRQALDTFLRDYCVAPCHPSISRGYLQKAANIIRSQGSRCEVARAGRIVALDGLGRRRGRRELVEKAQWLYQAELRAFQERMSDPRLACTTESIVMITLFGIYEVRSLLCFPPSQQLKAFPVHVAHFFFSMSR